MGKALRAWLMGAGLVLATGPAAAVSGDVSAYLGQYTLEEDPLDAAGVGSPGEVGVLTNLDFQWPVVVAFDVLWASEDTRQDVFAEFPLSLTTDVESLAVHAGVRYFFRKEETLRPYLGGGLAWTNFDVKQVENGSFGPGTEYETLVVDDGGSDISGWAGGGLLYRAGTLQFGVDLRYADASVEVTPAGFTDSLEVDASGIHAGVFVGLSW